MLILLLSSATGAVPVDPPVDPPTGVVLITLGDFERTYGALMFNQKQPTLLFVRT